MIRRSGPQWLTVSPDGTSYAAVLNTDHIIGVRWQEHIIPEDLDLKRSAQRTGKYHVLIDLVGGMTHSLGFNNAETAQQEFFRIGNELRGSVVDETKLGE